MAVARRPGAAVGAPGPVRRSGPQNRRGPAAAPAAAARGRRGGGAWGVAWGVPLAVARRPGAAGGALAPGAALILRTSAMSFLPRAATLWPSTAHACEAVVSANSLRCFAGFGHRPGRRCLQVDFGAEKHPGANSRALLSVYGLEEPPKHHRGHATGLASPDRPRITPSFPPSLPRIACSDLTQLTSTPALRCVDWRFPPT